LFEFSDPFFVNYIPLANENGQIITRNHSMELVVSRTANQQLAMEFIAQAVADSAAQNAHLGTNIPIMRRYLRQGLETDLNRLLVHVELPDEVNQTTAVQQAIDRLANYATWPTTFLHSTFLSSHQPVINKFSEVMQSNITAREAANQMYTATTAWFEKDRPAVEIYIPWEDQPRRTLSIRARNVDVRIIRQAAEAMQADWEARGIPYNFHAKIDYYHWTDAIDADTRSARFQAELMAGMGADIFMFDPFTHNINTLSNSGFLRNIYELIDADPNTSLDEFFTQALKAFEVNNGLYVFPTSFGMNYVGVNASIPQEFLDRFASKSSITLVEMMEFYIDLMDAHGDEFGHLVYTDAGGMTQFDNTLQAILGEFIDFNARTVNLTDPRFIEALELIGEVQARKDPRRIECLLWSSPWWDFCDECDRSLSMRRDDCYCVCRCPMRWCRTWWAGFTDKFHLPPMAESYLFYGRSQNFSQFNVFFTPVIPRFINHVPLANSEGRLLIDTPGAFRQVWSGISVTTRADGEFAWEFVRHLIYAYANPVSTNPITDAIPNRDDWGIRSLASPIIRSVFRENTMRNFNDAFNNFYEDQTFGTYELQDFDDFIIRSSRTRQFEAAIDRIAVYNEQPMAMLWPMIPPRLVQDPLDQFLRGLITAETAAQRMQNSVSLWMIE
jgi:hypothetical protein